MFFVERQALEDAYKIDSDDEDEEFEEAQPLNLEDDDGKLSFSPVPLRLDSNPLRPGCLGRRF